MNGGMSLDYPHYTRPAAFRGWVVPEAFDWGQSRGSGEMAAGGGVGKDAAESAGLAGVRCGASKGLRFRLIESSEWRHRREISLSAGRPIRGKRMGKRKSARSVRNDGWVCGGKRTGKRIWRAGRAEARRLQRGFGDLRAGLKAQRLQDLVMEIRRFGVKDAEALWRLRMIALQTDPWSFAESVEELRQIPVEEYGRRIGSGGDSSFVIGAFEGDVPVGMCGFYRGDACEAQA